MLAMKAAVGWAVEDNRGGFAEAAGPAGAVVVMILTIPTT
jgi:hypothetical protein